MSKIEKAILRYLRDQHPHSYPVTSRRLGGKRVFIVLSHADGEGLPLSAAGFQRLAEELEESIPPPKFRR
jgi:hypothetical protein